MLTLKHYHDNTNYFLQNILLTKMNTTEETTKLYKKLYGDLAGNHMNNVIRSRIAYEYSKSKKWKFVEIFIVCILRQSEFQCLI